MIEVEKDFGVVGGKHSPVGVIVDLGEIEISLADLVHLTPGSIIELEKPDCLQCTLKIGSSAFAQGEISSEPARMIIRITEVAT